MAYQGMDVDVVDGVVHRLRAEAHRMQLTALVDQLVMSALHAWPGPDADEFHAMWTNHHRPRLMSAADSVGALADRLQREVDQQRAASGAAPGAGGHAGSGRGTLAA